MRIVISLRGQRALLAIACVLSVFVGTVQTQSAGWTVPTTAKTETSPLGSTPDVLKKGKSVFTSRCQRCHGPAGKGNGPDSDPDQPAADLTDPSHAAINPEGVMFYKVWNGRKNPTMPAFKAELSKDEVWSVVEYVKSLRK
jgi:mono/diheme cytochrome c family protein